MCLSWNLPLRQLGSGVLGWLALRRHCPWLRSVTVRLRPGASNVLTAPCCSNHSALLWQGSVRQPTGSSRKPLLLDARGRLRTLKAVPAEGDGGEQRRDKVGLLSALWKCTVVVVLLPTVQRDDGGTPE